MREIGGGDVAAKKNSGQPRASAPTKIDWETIKTEYITSDVSQSELAKKYGINRAQIAKRCARDGWVEQRNRYVSDVLQKTLTKSAARDANRLDKLRRITSSLIDVALRGISEDPEQYNRYIVTEGIGEGQTMVSEKTFSKLDTRALKDTVNALKDLTAMVRDFYDLPTAAQREQREIAAARLEIERQKAQLSSDVDDDETGVIVLQEVKGE